MSTVQHCEFCGKPRAPYRERFCSPECLAASMRKPVPLCKQCGTEFKPARKSARFCGLDCFNASRVAAKHLVPKPHPVPNCEWLPLTQGQFALVDASLYEELSQFSWCAVKVRPNSRGPIFYAKRTDIPVYLHRYLMQPGDGEEVDHKNGDTLDHRVGNLLVCDRSGNGQNRLVRVGKLSGYKGVHATGSGNWVVRFCHKGVEEYGGTFEDKEEAARKYDSIVRRYGRVNSTYNFPLSGERSAVTGQVQP